MSHGLHAVLGDAMHQLFALRGVLDPSRAVPGLGASVSEALALRHLAAEGALTQAEVATRLGLDKSTVSRLVSGLESKGWVARRPDPADRRSTRVELTPAGRTAAREVAAATSRRHDRVLAVLGEEEQAALAVGLPALVRALEASAEDDAPES